MRTPREALVAPQSPLLQNRINRDTSIVLIAPIAPAGSICADQANRRIVLGPTPARPLVD